MEAGWERTEGYRKLSLAEINDYVSLLEVEAVESELLVEGKANTNYRVMLEDGRQVVLRLHLRDQDSGPLEKAIADCLHQVVPVPQVLAFDARRASSLIEWRPGLSMERLLALGRDDEVRSAAEGIGAALASISSVHFESAGFLNAELTVSSPWDSSVDGLLGYLEFCLERDALGERLSREEVVAIRDLASATRPRLLEVAGPNCLVHGDYKASNLLIHEGRLSAVLDWEFAHSGSYLFSFGQLFRHERALPRGFREGVVGGFTAAGGTLPPDWERLAKVLDLVNLIDFLSREDAGPQMVEATRDLVRATVNCLT